MRIRDRDIETEFMKHRHRKHTQLTFTQKERNTHKVRGVRCGEEIIDMKRKERKREKQTHTRREKRRIRNTQRSIKTKNTEALNIQTHTYSTQRQLKTHAHTHKKNIVRGYKIQKETEAQR